MDIKVIESSSAGNCYIASDGKTTILLDAGVNFKKIQIAMNFRTTDIKGVLITHSHQDHCKAVRELFARGINIYLSQGTKDEINVNSHRLKIVKSLSKYEIGTLVVMPFDVEHDTAEPMGFWIKSNATGESLLYFTDTYYIKYTFDGVTHIIAECNYTEEAIAQSIKNGVINASLGARIYKSHMSLETLLKTINSMNTSKLQQIYIGHLSNNNSNEKVMLEELQKATGVEIIVC